MVRDWESGNNTNVQLDLVFKAGEKKSQLNTSDAISQGCQKWKYWLIQP